MTLLDVQNVPELFAAARAISGPPLGTADFASSRIVGVFPNGSENLARGFFEQDPSRQPLPPPNSGQFVALVPAMSASGLSWLEPSDVNAAGLVVGQAQGSLSTLRYAFTRPAPSGPVTPVPGLNDPGSWVESKATAVNTPVGVDPQGKPLTAVVVGWKKPTTGNERAFYWMDGTRGTLDIPITQCP